MYFIHSPGVLSASCESIISIVLPTRDTIIHPTESSPVTTMSESEYAVRCNAAHICARGWSNARVPEGRTKASRAV